MLMMLYSKLISLNFAMTLLLFCKDKHNKNVFNATMYVCKIPDLLFIILSKDVFLFDWAMWPYSKNPLKKINIKCHNAMSCAPENRHGHG